MSAALHKPFIHFFISLFLLSSFLSSAYFSFFHPFLFVEREMFAMLARKSLRLRRAFPLLAQLPLQPPLLFRALQFRVVRLASRVELVTLCMQSSLLLTLLQHRTNKQCTKKRLVATSQKTGGKAWDKMV